MADYAVAIKKDSPVWKLYQKLKADGVKDSDLDTGYPETDHANKTRNTVHRDDHQIDEPEVLNYALENYERYQLAIKETTGYEVPWSLDDLDPATDFDAKIREQIKQTIGKFKPILAAQWEEGTIGYNELMAIALFAYARAPRQKTGPVQTPVAISKVIKQDLRKAGLDEIIGLLAANGGLGLSIRQKKCAMESTALDAMRKNCRSRSENSYVLHGVFGLAGLNGGNLSMPPRGGGAIVLHIGFSSNIFDLYHGLSNVGPDDKKYASSWWFEQTKTEYLAIYYNNLGVRYLQQNKRSSGVAALKTALSLDPYLMSVKSNLKNAQQLDP
jgi:hypothetical protein